MRGRGVLMLGGSLGQAALLTACAQSPVITVAPVIDTPPPSSLAAAFPDITELEISVAHAGSDTDIVSATFARGEPLVVSGVPLGDDLVIHMTGRVSGSVVGYGRTCPFAVSASAAAPSPHLFFARDVFWSSGDAADAQTVRIGGAALTYHDGSAIWFGGVDATGLPVTELDRFSPNAGAFVALAPAAARLGAAFAPLPDGRLVIVGGADGSGVGADYLELVEADNTAARQVQKVAGFPQLGRTGMTATATTSIYHPLITIGGTTSRGTSGEIDEIIADANGVRSKSSQNTLATARSRHTATRLGDDVGAPILIVGGLDGAGMPVPSAELYKPLSYEVLASGGSAPMMRVPRSQHLAARLPDGSVLIVGGLDAAGVPVATLERFTLDQGFIDAGTLPNDVGLLDVTAVTLPDGRVLFAGGRRTVDGPPVAATFQAFLDPQDGNFVLLGTDPLAVPRAGARAALLCDGTVLLSGGTSAASVPERYNPSPDGRR